MVTRPASFTYLSSTAQARAAKASLIRPARKNAHKLTPNKIIRACRKGARLCLRHGAKATYSLQPPGVFVPVRYALGAIRSGHLVPARDGLFAGHSQSWVAP
jgi:hypothetical protein